MSDSTPDSTQPTAQGFAAFLIGTNDKNELSISIAVGHSGTLTAQADKYRTSFNKIAKNCAEEWKGKFSLEGDAGTETGRRSEEEERSFVPGFTALTGLSLTGTSMSGASRYDGVAKSIWREVSSAKLDGLPAGFGVGIIQVREDDQRQRLAKSIVDGKGSCPVGLRENQGKRGRN